MNKKLTSKPRNLSEEKIFRQIVEASYKSWSRHKRLNKKQQGTEISRRAMLKTSLGFGMLSPPAVAAALVGPSPMRGTGPSASLSSYILRLMRACQATNFNQISETRISPPKDAEFKFIGEVSGFDAPISINQVYRASRELEVISNFGRFFDGCNIDEEGRISSLGYCELHDWKLGRLFGSADSLSVSGSVVGSFAPDDLLALRFEPDGELLIRDLAIPVQELRWKSNLHLESNFMDGDRKVGCRLVIRCTLSSDEKIKRLLSKLGCRECDFVSFKEAGEAVLELTPVVGSRGQGYEIKIYPSGFEIAKSRPFNGISEEENESVGLRNWLVATNTSFRNIKGLILADIASENSYLDSNWGKIEIGEQSDNELPGQFVWDIAAGFSGKFFASTRAVSTFTYDGDMDLQLSLPEASIVEINPTLETAQDVSRVGLSTAKIMVASNGVIVSVDAGGDKYESVIPVKVRRARDQLAILILLINCKQSTLSNSRFRKIRENLDAYIVFDVGSQHLGEQAFPKIPNTDTILPPLGEVDRRMAGHSWVAFSLADVQGWFNIDQALLDNWNRRGWKISLVPELRDRNSVAPPTLHETNLEIPYRLHISPSSSDKVSNQDIFWIGVGKDKKNSSRRSRVWAKFLSDNPVTLLKKAFPARAVYSPDYIPTPGGGNPNLDPTEPRMSISPKNRHDLVALSHVKSNDPKENGRPFFVNRLGLSMYGGWLNAKGEWPGESRAFPNTTLLRWDHQADLGRDNYVKVDNLYWMLPDSHKCLVTKLTTREPLRFKTKSTVLGKAASLEQIIYVTRRQFRKNYRSDDYPFVSTEVLTEESPIIDPEVLDLITNKITYADSAIAFWPTINGSPLYVDFQYKDWSGNAVVGHKPVMLIEDSLNAMNNLDKILNIYRTSGPKRIISFQSTDISVAASTDAGEVGETTLAVHEIAFDAQKLWKSSDGYVPDAMNAPFRPMVEAYLSEIPALSAHLSGEVPRVWFAPYKWADPKNVTGVFVASTSKPTDYFGALSTSNSANFDNDTSKSGGVISPSFNVGGMSRSSGPFGGDPGTYSGGRFEPSSFFSGAGDFLNTFPYEQLLESSEVGETNAGPSFSLTTNYVADDFPTRKVRIHWETTRFKNLCFGIAEFKVHQNPPTKMQLEGGYEWYLANEKPPEMSIEGRLENFSVKVVIAGNGVEVIFCSASFNKTSGGELDCDIDIDAVVLVGALLEFLSRLQSFLGPKIAGNNRESFEIDVNPRRIRVLLPTVKVPSIEMGFFGLSGLKINSYLELPFKTNNNERLTFTYLFSTRRDQFQVSVCGWSGSGFLGLKTTTKNIVQCQVAIQFGAIAAVDLGVGKGQLFIFGGFYYSRQVSPDRIEFAAYVRAGGSLLILGIVTVSAELYVALEIIKEGPNSVARGVCRFTGTIKLGCFKKGFTIEYVQRIAGSNTSEIAISSVDDSSSTGYTLPDLMTDDEWAMYWNASRRSS